MLLSIGSSRPLGSASNTCRPGASAATAVRIKGMPHKGQLIQIEGIAIGKRPSFNERKRIMPPGSWDWEHTCSG